MRLRNGNYFVYTTEKRVTDLLNSVNSRTRKYIYNGENIIAEFNDSNQLLARYLHSPLKADDILSAEISSQGVNAGLAQTPGAYYFLKDAIGSVTDVTASSGEVVQRNEYSSFGILKKTTDAVGTDTTNNPVFRSTFTFTGREFDTETGLYYYRARYYDAEIGRFLSTDPAEGNLKNPISVVNKYVYVENNPHNLVDPSGKFPPDVHGNYCGNDDNYASPDGGLRPDRSGNVVYPEDDLDRACYKHDRAYRDGAKWTNHNWDDNWARVETDFGLVQEGLLFSNGHYAEGLSVAIFGSIMLSHSLSTLPVSMVFSGIESLFQNTYFW